MPYIAMDKRKEIDCAVNGLVELLKKAPVESQDGMFNYALTKMLKDVYPRKYFSFNRLVGMMECCKLEMYRHIIGPYEDKKITENGDVE